MSSFEAAIPVIFTNEGGYQKNANDMGNYNSRSELVGTNRGISAPVYEQWIGRVPTETDMRNISQSIAMAIYKAWFWDKYKLSEITDQHIATHIFDLFVNHSPRAAALIVQRAINDLKPLVQEDGVFGALTRKAINDLIKINPQALNSAIIKERKDYYNSLGQNTFISGWLARAEKFGNYVVTNATTISTVGLVAVCLFIGYQILNQ
jgi:lysozyme family protein